MGGNSEKDKMRFFNITAHPQRRTQMIKKNLNLNSLKIQFLKKNETANRLPSSADFYNIYLFDGGALDL
jgi:hypothetical protein